MRNSYFLAGGTPKNDDLLRKTAAQIATPHTATGCQTRTPRGGVWDARRTDHAVHVGLRRRRVAAEHHGAVADEGLLLEGHRDWSLGVD